MKSVDEGPPVVGYDGRTNIDRLATPPPHQRVRLVGEVVLRQHAVSSNEEQ